MKIIRWKHPNATDHLVGLLQGFGELADGMVTVLSLAFLMSDFELSVASWRARLQINRAMRH